MAIDAFLKYTDAHGITGDSTVTSIGGVDVTDHSEIMQVAHSVESPRDRASGMARGRRFHTPLRLLKRIDKATPLLYQALVQNQVLPKLELLWFQPNATDGSTENFYIIMLEGASVVKLETLLRDTRDPAQAIYPPLEWVEFSYQKITWTHVEGSRETSDDWQTASPA